MAKQVLYVDDAVEMVIRLCKWGVAINKDSLREEFEIEAYTLGSDYRVGFVDGFETAKDSIKCYVNSLEVKMDMENERI